MPWDAFVLKIQRELCLLKCARKVSGLSRNGPRDSNEISTHRVFFFSFSNFYSHQPIILKPLSIDVFLAEGSECNMKCIRVTNRHNLKKISSYLFAGLSTQVVSTTAIPPSKLPSIQRIEGGSFFLISGLISPFLGRLLPRLQLSLDEASPQ